jgi:xyloglucan-specific exo-beta-1,4-glucanase
MGWVIDPSEPQKMYAGGHPGFYRSGDGGESWEKENSGLPGTDVHGLGMDLQNPETLYASIVKRGLYQSPDAGRSWELVNARVGTMGPILVDPRDSDTLNLAGEDGLLRSTNGGESWKQVGEIPGGTATSISQDRESPDTFYVAVAGRVSKSTDGGEGWQTVGEGLPEGVSVVQVAQGDPRIVYAGILSESGVVLFRSEDGGENWEARN